MSTITRWGIIGTGDIARRTLPDLRQCENLEVLAIGSRSSHTAAAFAAEWEIPRAYGSHAELLADPDIDVVYICTPHGSHAALIQQSLIAGKNVLCEKPLTLTADEARTCAALAADRGLFLMEAMWMKFSPTFRSITETLRSGLIGDPAIVQAGFGFPAPSFFERFWDPAQGGGALLDLGVYTVTFAQALLGQPSGMTVCGSIREDGVDLYESITLTYPDSRMAVLNTAITHCVPPTASIGGSTGIITVDLPFWMSGGYWIFEGLGPGAPEPTYRKSVVEGAGYVPMFRAVSSAVSEGLTQHPECTLADTIAVLELLDEARAQLMASR